MITILQFVQNVAREPKELTSFVLTPAESKLQRRSAFNNCWYFIIQKIYIFEAFKWELRPKNRLWSQVEVTNRIDNC